MGIEEKVDEPARPQDGKKAVFDLCASGLDTRLDHREFVLDGALAFVLHGAGDHRLVRRSRVDHTWLRDVAKLIIDAIELLEFRHVPLLLIPQNGRPLAGVERLHLHTGDPAVEVDLVARFPKFAIAVDIVAEFDLFAYQVCDTRLHQLIKRCLVGVSAGLHDRCNIVGI
jgi:hypothetical protein